MSGLAWLFPVPKSLRKLGWPRLYVSSSIKRDLFGSVRDDQRFLKLAKTNETANFSSCQNRTNLPW